jgi:hypothetical protein
LDATAAGRPLYERLGFVAEYEVARWTGSPLTPSPGQPAQPYLPDCLPAVAALDTQATGADRTRLLARLAQEAPESARVVHRGGEVTAYLFCRAGEPATQIGPCGACVEADGSALLAAALARSCGQAVMVDVPRANRAATALARAAGLTEQRSFTRMRRGQPLRDRPELIWASSGPEKG